MRIGGADVLLVNHGGVVHAYEDRCPHAGSRLSEGSLAGPVLRCATHHWDFDVRTGDGVNPASCRLSGYAVRIVDGQVQVRVRR